MPRLDSKLSLLSICSLLSLCFQGAARGEDAHQVSGGAVRIARDATRLGRVAGSQSVHLAISLEPRDVADLQDYARRVTDPSDELYKHFLTPDESKARFAPSDEEVAEVRQYLEDRGLQISKVHGNNMLIEADGSAEAVEDAMQVQLQQYISADGRVVRAPSSEPYLPDSVARLVQGVHGLNTFSSHVKHSVKGAAVSQSQAAPPSPGVARAHAVEPRSNYGLRPSDIRDAYGISGFSNPGSGQSVALFELDDYNQSDIDYYANNYGISPEPNVQRIYLSGASHTPGSGIDEVTLDIELAMAMAPNLTNIYVYEGPNSDAGVVATYNQIQHDNYAKNVSTSWGLAENYGSSYLLQSENNIFSLMATQGQSMFAASGDSGAYDDSYRPGNLAVDDPASQPYVTAVGGTTLYASSGAYLSETSWGTSSNRTGGGGGNSTIWGQPTYQNNFANSANGGSSTKRMVPDVSLNANPNTGYYIWVSGGWNIYGGTSCAAPLWAAFAAIVNQGLAAANSSPLGFANPSLYQIGQSTIGSSVFHDISDNSTNLYFKAVSGYDLSTGLGTLRGQELYNALLSPLPPLPPTTVTATSPSNFSMHVTWTQVAGATKYQVYRYSSSNSTPTLVHTYTDGTLALDDLNEPFQPYYYYYVVVTTSTGTSGAGMKAAVSPLVPDPPSAPASNSLQVSQ